MSKIIDTILALICKHFPPTHVKELYPYLTHPWIICLKINFSFHRKHSCSNANWLAYVCVIDRKWQRNFKSYQNRYPTKCNLLFF